MSKSEQKHINSRKLIGWFNGLGLKQGGGGGRELYCFPAKFLDPLRLPV